MAEDLVAVHGACFPHSAERGAIWRSINTTDAWKRQLLAAWRLGYLDAACPTASQYSNHAAPGAHGANFRRILFFEYRAGFRQRRDEMLGALVTRRAFASRVPVEVA